MTGSNRIILNTLASYGQSLVGLVLTLFSARWLLMALGHTDYGLFGVVGSTILLMTILTGGLSVGIARFYAFSIGEGKTRSREESQDDLTRWFNAALSIHIVLPVIIFMFGTPLGEYAIKNWLTIPADRLAASLWVFRISMISALANVVGVPFVSMLNAYQRIYVVSATGIIRSICTFIIAWVMLHAEGDRLILYAVYMASVGVAIQLILMYSAYRSFPCCRVRLAYFFEWGRIKQLFNYTGWKMFGMSCVALRAQGTPIVINLHFGPVVNATYTVASSLSNQANALSAALTRAFQPAVVTAEGSGDRERMISMAMRVCKFGSLLVMAFAIPAIIEMENLLQLWLVDPPEHAAAICQWLLAMLFVDQLTGGHRLAVNAFGKIAIYEIVQGPILLSAVPLMALLFSLGFGPVSVGYALFVTMVIYCSARIAFAKKLVGFPFLLWVKQVFMPILGVLVLSLLLGVFSQHVLVPSLSRILVTSAITISVTGLASWIFLFAPDEKALLYEMVNRFRSKLSPA